MEGNGLRAKDETMDGREQTPSGMGSGVDLELYVDSDFASRDTNRRSVPGGVVVCAGACSVSFFFRTQKNLTLLLRQSMLGWPRGSRRRFFLRYIWSFIFPDRDVGCTLVKEDNVGAIHLAKNPATTPNSKHIDIRHHFIRERVANGEFELVYVPSEEQHADFLTKIAAPGGVRSAPKFCDEYSLTFFSCG